MKPCKAQGSPVCVSPEFCGMLSHADQGLAFMNSLQLFRCTGRTTRMVKQAMSAALDGRAVYIIVATKSDQYRIEEIIESLGHKNHGIKVECPPPSNFDWEQMRLKGAHPNCMTFVDHYAIETRFSRMLEELHRYNADVPVAPPCSASLNV